MLTGLKMLFSHFMQGESDYIQHQHQKSQKIVINFKHYRFVICVDVGASTSIGSSNF